MFAKPKNDKVLLIYSNVIMLHVADNITQTRVYAQPICRAGKSGRERTHQTSGNRRRNQANHE